MKKDWKNWKLSDSGLQIYEGNKHIATVHYGGNPIVDINEAVENAKMIQQAPDLTARVKELEEALNGWKGVMYSIPLVNIGAGDTARAIKLVEKTAAALRNKANEYIFSEEGES